MRKTIGHISYPPPAAQRIPDPDMEAARREVLMDWRRKQIAELAKAHVNRVIRRDGLARSIDELYDRDGRPPPHVDLESMVGQLKKLKGQHGWLTTIAASCRERLRELDLPRFLREIAAIEAELMNRRAAREGAMTSAATNAYGDRKLPPKLAAVIREDVSRDMRRRELRVVRGGDLVGTFYLSMPRRMQEIMRYLFFEHVPAHLAPDGAADPDTRYRFLFGALHDLEMLIEDLRSNIYELQEYVESADMIAMRYE